MRPDRTRDARMDDLVREVLAKAARRGGVGTDSASPSASDAGCPAAEVFSAYTEGSLSGAEQDRFEGHLAFCESCRAVICLAVESRPAATPDEAGLARVARRWWVPQFTFRWLAPAAAALAGVALYFVVAGGPAMDHPGGGVAGRGATVAENQQTPGEKAYLRERLASPGQEQSGSKSEPKDRARPKAEMEPSASASRSTPASRGVPAIPGGATRGSAKEPPAAAASPVPSQQVQPGAPPAWLAAADRVEALPVAQQPPATARRAGAEETPVGIQAQRRAAQADPARTEKVVADKVRAETIADVGARGAAEKGRVAGGLPGGVVGGVVGGAVSGEAKMAPAESRSPAPSRTWPVRAVAPDGSTEWQFDAGGVVRRSTDGGRTWFTQPRGTAGAGTVLAASAPASDVCWAVGQQGLVIVTAHGDRWHARSFPEALDLVSIAARDANRAVVTAADGRRFETTDGGFTWALVR
ncbi:MAG: zf-HC2 domain-containing protein [Vicinamibacterales bacterium]